MIKWHTMKPYPTTYCLTTLEELKAWAKKNKSSVPDIPEQNIGTTLQFGSRFAIVIKADQHKDHWEVVDTLIHESTHIFQGAMKYIGESQIGDEVEAYTIAQIATNLLKDYQKTKET